MTSIQLQLPPSVERFRQRYLQVFRAQHWDTQKSYLYGGALRDLHWGGVVKDYDWVTGISLDKLKKAFDKYGIEHEPGTDEGDPHVYVWTDDDRLIQLGEKRNIIPDFTCNTLQWNIGSGRLQGTPQAFYDIQHRLLRNINTTPVLLRRFIYMCHKYDDVTPVPETLALLQKLSTTPEQMKGFMSRKGLSSERILEIAERWGLASKFKFLRPSK